MPYTADKPPLPETTEELRARIPGWGADLDPANRPSYPKERFAPQETGAHWDLPESQPDPNGRERSIEHLRLTPVFGTAQPLHGVSGAIRRFAYAHYSEGRAAHWLLLVVGDRVDSVGAHLRSFATLRPDNPVTQTGVLGERGRRPLASRFGRHRADLKHAWLDPVIVVGPWVLSIVGAVAILRRVARLF
ncbi:hypothetical protein G5T42_08845 [Microbacterium sp. 4R-513]|uniref:hypothetical protein n=1 Tax=Microbacterium sp. 4R-513 TaxID=2567934 RepID=UPI0013E1F7A6|nr:hypothetical protein [Microbacterium sp. 4R-513]QIG39581.1 hypothetical protein G5T42_08845 [Microbacterium sp. 4R-513]